MKNRNTVELMVLALTAVVVAAVLFGGATVAYLEYRDPTVDHSQVEEHLFNVISTILGALLGLLTARGLDRRDRDDELGPPR